MPVRSFSLPEKALGFTSTGFGVAFSSGRRSGLQHGHRWIEVRINCLKGGDPNLFGLGIHNRLDVAITRDDRHVRERFGFGTVGHSRDRERCRCVIIVRSLQP